MDMKTHWNAVTLPNGNVWTYPTLEKANNARILARAWFNLIKSNPGKKITWVHVARELGIARKGRGPGMTYYSMFFAGRLPTNPTVRDKLFNLAGYPWE